MFGIGMQEVAIILVVALIFIGPAKLPQAARSIGKGLRELRRASDDLKSAVMVEMDDEDESWRKPAKQAPSKLGAYSDQSVSSAAVAGSLVATGEAGATEAGDAADAAATPEETSSEPAHTVSRDDPAPVTADASAGPDPMDADDHSGMPYAPNSPEMDEAIDAARAKFAVQSDQPPDSAASSEADSKSKSVAS